jgi:hypothetical protein
MATGNAPEHFETLMIYLNEALTFRAFRPGASPEQLDISGDVVQDGQVGFSAEVVVKNPVDKEKFYLTQLPEIAFVLQDTPDPPGDPEGYRPARLFLTQSGTGTELVVESLPVEIQIPSVLLAPLRAENDGLADVPLTEPFEPGVHDSLAVILRDVTHSSIFVHIRLRMTEERDFIIEPAVPISIGPCRFNGLPCRGLHDLSFVPSPNLRGEHDPGEQALEWTRHTINPVDRFFGDALYSGVITARTIDLDGDRTPLKELRERLNSDPDKDQVEFVLEDVSLPWWSLQAPVPLPVHATFGLRREIEYEDSIDQAFDLTTPPTIDIGDYKLILEQFLLRTPASLDPLDQFLFFRLNVQRDELFADDFTSLTIGIDDEWTLQIGARFPEGRLPFLIADAEFSFWGLRAGLSLRRIVEYYSVDFEAAQELGYEWYNYWQLLFDMAIVAKGDGDKSGFRLASLSGKDLELPIAGLGWDLDGITLGTFSMPEGVQLIFGEAMRLIIEEFGWITDPNGGRYISFSGGVTIGGLKGETERGKEIQGEGSATLAQEKTWLGIRFYRLRFRTSGNEKAPRFLLDGISLSMTLGSFGLTGFGMVSEFVQDGHQYKEGGLGLQVRFGSGGNAFLIGAQLFLGSVSGPVHNFKYWLAAAQFSPLPIGAIMFVNLRALIAFNLMPELPPPDGSDQNLRLFRWYKDHYSAAASFKVTDQTFDTLRAEGVDEFVIEDLNGIKDQEVRGRKEFLALLKDRLGDQLTEELQSLILKHAGSFDLPASRALVGWKPEDDAWTLSAGLGVEVGGQKAFTIDCFLLFSKRPAGFGFAAGMEIYLFANPDPVGFGVFEYDSESEKWSVLIGVSFSLDKVLPFKGPGLFGDIASLTGTLYIGNRPGTVAVGQLNDQTTWLSLRFQTKGPFETEALVAYCQQYVDSPTGPFGTGLVISVKGAGKFGVGKVEVYGSFGFIMGAWRNESQAFGILATLEMGFRIKVFWVFNFGISTIVEFDFLGPDSVYWRIGVEIRIETPWYMPDATFRFEKTKGDPQAERLEVVSSPIVGADALEPGKQQQIEILALPLSGDTIDELAVLSMDDIRALDDPTTPPVGIDGLTPVSIDSTIGLNFKPAVDDLTSVGEETPDGAGTQAPVEPAKNKLSITYELIELGVRRRPRFGPDAGDFTVLLDPEDSHLGAQPDPPLDPETVLSFKWDKDMRRNGRWDPRRLLVNADTPYSFVISNPEADESLVRDEESWPCCPPDGRQPNWHGLDFEATPFGTRVPSSQFFSSSNSALHWIGALPPFVRPGIATPGDPPVAVVDFMRHGDGVFAAIHFDELASVCEIYAFWFAHSFSLQLVVEVYRGIEQIDELQFELFNPSPPAPIVVSADDGMTSIILRRTGTPPQDDPDPEELRTNWVEFLQMRYLSRREERIRIASLDRCGLNETQELSGKGKLAWLPNQEYEISATTNVILQHENTEPQLAEVRQKFFFQTKGLPGLNAVDRIGDEVEPYVESYYPRQAPQTLYRSEPLTLAFNERFNILAPLVRETEPDAPLERRQVLEWVMAVEKMGDVDDGQRITQTSADWIVDNRSNPFPPNSREGLVLDGGIFKMLVRQAPTRDPFRKRLEKILHRPEGCDVPRPLLHDSLVLVHEPADPQAPDGEPMLWAPGAYFRVNVRRKDGPFVERKPFDGIDFTAFTFLDELGQPSTGWRVTDGAMHVFGSPADTIRRLALFGDDWNHVQIYATIDPEGGSAGLAVGASGIAGAFSAMFGLIDEGSGQLRLIERRNGSATEVASVPLDDGAASPFFMQVLAFDDMVQVRVGEAIVEGPRGEAREGRLALVAQGGGRFQSLSVEPLDGYRFYFQSSRYADFEAHIDSFEGETERISFGEIGQDDPDIVSSLLTQTEAEVDALMDPDAGVEERQRLFDRWAQDLVLPLAQDSKRLQLTRLIGQDGLTQLISLESPEPLAFSEDVSLVLKQQTMNPTPREGFPPELLELASAIRFGNNRFQATVQDEALGPILSSTERLVRARGQSFFRRFEVYTVSTSQSDPDRTIVSGDLVQTIPFFNPSNPILENLGELRDGQFALLADDNTLVVEEMIPIIELVFETVALKILTNGSETKALFIPMNGGTHAPLADGEYRFSFEIDRARFRTQTPNELSNCRASKAINVQW